MKILITGGAGFIGSHVADRFIEAGHEAVILDDLSTGIREYVPDQAPFYKEDLVSGDLEKIFKKHDFDAVSHHAAQIDVRTSVREPSRDAMINVYGGVRLLELCEKYGIKKFLFASTGGAIYGEQEAFPATEEHPIRPCSPYGLDKYLFENYLSYYQRRGVFDVVSLRYANVYGPRQNPHGEAGVVAIFIDKLLGSQTPVINGDGKQTRDFISVYDIAAGNIAALNLTGAHVINLGTGIETDINQIYELVAKSMGSRVQAEHGPAKDGEQRRSVISNEKAARLLNWAPEISLGDGIQQTVDWFSSKCVR